MAGYPGRPVMAAMPMQHVQMVAPGAHPTPGVHFAVPAQQQQAGLPGVQRRSHRHVTLPAQEQEQQPMMTRTRTHGAEPRGHVQFAEQPMNGQRSHKASYAEDLPMGQMKSIPGQPQPGAISRSKSAHVHWDRAPNEAPATTTPAAAQHPGHHPGAHVQFAPAANEMSPPGQAVRRQGRATTLHTPNKVQQVDITPSTATPGSTRHSLGFDNEVPMHAHRTDAFHEAPPMTATKTDNAPPQRRQQKARTMGQDALKGGFHHEDPAADQGETLNVSVVGPGSGSGINAVAFSHMKRLGLKIIPEGGSRTPYDRYPEAWVTAGGAPPPNLESFATDLIANGVCTPQKSDVIVFGSRGGQVVLPTFWKAKGDAVPPVVCMNGGCAMRSLPTPVAWPVRAVSFLLLGGRDYFKNKASPKEWLAEAVSSVPAPNGTTAILLVNEMEHMPAAQLLMAILQHMIRAVHSWKATGQPPRQRFETILQALQRGACWSGTLKYTIRPGHWESFSFSPDGFQQTA